MEMDKMAVTRRFFSLTLEIIYLLTGEDFVVVRESGELVSRRANHVVSSDSHGGSVASIPPTASCEIKSEKKILKLTSKVIHLLTGEVRRFVGSNEDVAELSQISPRDGNSPDRSPLYSWDSSDDDLAVQQDYEEDNVISIKVEGEDDPFASGKDPGKEKEVQEIPLEISTDGSRDTPQRCPRPLVSMDSIEEPQEIPQDCQAENLDSIKVVTVDGDDKMKGTGMEVLSDHDGKEDFPPPRTLDSHHSSTWSSNQLVTLDGKIFVCYECGKCVVYDANLQEEAAGGSTPLCCNCDNAAPLKPFHCNKCGKSFSSKMVYMAHQSVHTGGQSFPCGECGMAFSNKSILETHRSIHTGDRPFSCSECGKCFAMKANLVKHLKVHKGEKPFTCQECGKSFGMKSNLAKHQRVHTGEKPFECDLCGRTFGMKSNLIKHQRIHTGEKPFKCLECGKCFASRSNLTTHEKIHTGEKPFACSLCGKGFITSSDLSRHHKTHTGERPFVCSDCGKSFSSKSILSAHQKSHSGANPALTSQPGLENLDSSSQQASVQPMDASLLPQT